MKVFLSHATTDRGIAAAIKVLLVELFGEPRVQVEFSSDQDAGGGIPPGARWLPWITERISQADKTYVLLTPSSLARPWVLWESGAAVGVALATNRTAPVVPITFGLAETEIPSPFEPTQAVRGDSTEPGGIHRLLQDVNEALGRPLTKTAFEATTLSLLANFLTSVRASLAHAVPVQDVLASVPAGFPTSTLAGHWVTAYDFGSQTPKRHHADIAIVTPAAERRVIAANDVSMPRTEGHETPFLNRIDAELVNRHVIGAWKNLSDQRYFGAVHLGVLSGEAAMDGFYTSFVNDVSVGMGRWMWARLAPKTLHRINLAEVVLREPRDIYAMLEAHTQSSGPGPLPIDRVIVRG